MNSHWLKPNKVGIAFLIIFLVILFYFFLAMNSLNWFCCFIPVTLPLASYPIFMIIGKSIENRRKLKDRLVCKDITAWICFIAFLIIVAIALDLGCYRLSPYLGYWAGPPHMPTVFFLPIVLSIVWLVVRWNTVFVIFLTGAILLEICCAELSFHTLGEIASFVYYIFIGLNIIPVILYVVKFKRTAAFIILGIALWLAPEQLSLGYRYVQLQDEAHAIVEYVNKTKIETGSYPKDLSGYKFKNPHLEKHIQEYRAGDNDFTLRYYVGTTGTSHSYSPEVGWSYYPD